MVASKRLVYLTLVAVIAFLISNSLDYAQGYWLIWAALLFSLVTSGDSFKRRVTIIVTTGVMAAFSAFIAGSLHLILPLLAIYLFILVFACVYISQTYTQHYLSAFIIVLFTILASGMTTTLAESGDRFVLMVGGALIAALLQILFYPYFIRNEWRAYIIFALQQLKKLNNDIFACFLDSAYPDNIYLYERRIHIQKIGFMRVMDKLRKINTLIESKLSLAEKEAYQQRLLRLDLLYDNMLDYSQIRRRVTDYTTFSVCSQELTGISQEITNAIDSAIAHFTNKKVYSNTTILHEKIYSLENNYHQVLQVASREPLAFLLLIDSLNAFKDNIDMFNAIPLLSSTSYS